MNNSIKYLALTIFIISTITFASWWNPLSWFDNWGREDTNKVEVLEEKIKDLEEKVEDEVVNTYEEEMEDSDDDDDEGDMEEAYDMIETAKYFLEKLELAINDLVTASAEAQDALEDAEQSFDNGDYDEAIEEAKAAAQEVLDVLGVGDMEEAYDMIETAEYLIEELEWAIDDAESDQDGYDDAVDELAEAQDALEDAEQAFDNGDYEEAKAAAQEVLDVLGVGDIETMTNLDPNDEANYMISNAEDLIEELESAIDDAVDELGDAQYVLEEAEQAFDNGDYDEAIEEAKAATQEVLDVLGVGDMVEAYDMDDES